MTTQHLARSEGTLSYDVQGEGPLVVCSPGFGDLRSTYARLTAGLAEAGFRAAAVDLRGHGGSSTGWPSHTGADVAGDLLALAGELDDRPAVLLGNSYRAARPRCWPTGTARPPDVGVQRYGPEEANRLGEECG